jgi:hypothetical protein
MLEFSPDGLKVATDSNLGDFSGARICCANAGDIAEISAPVSTSAKVRTPSTSKGIFGLLPTLDLDKAMDTDANLRLSLNDDAMNSLSG